MVSGPGYMRNPNPKHAKVSFLSYNVMRLFSWIPSAEYRSLQHKIFCCCPVQKVAWSLFKATIIATGPLRPFGIVIHSRCREEERSTRNQETTQKDFEILYEAFTSTPTNDRNPSTVYQTVQPAWKLGRFIFVTFTLTIPIRGCPKNVHNKHHRIISRWLQGSSSSPIIDFRCNLYNSFFILRFCRRSSFYGCFAHAPPWDCWNGS